MKEVVGFVWAVVGRNKLPVKFEDRKEKERSSVSLQYVYLKEEVCLDTDDPISSLPQKEQG